MFFILSKVLDFIIQPMNWIIFFVVMAFFIKKPFLKKVFVGLSICSFLIFTTPLPIHFAKKCWNIKTKRLNEIKSEYDVAIVLGGFLRTVKSEPDQFYIASSGDRLIKAIQLYKAKKVKKIFISGGSGKVLVQEFKEGRIAARFLKDIGIDTNDIIYEELSKNTYENAVQTKYKLDSLGLSNSKLILLTSKYHMKRSIACFNKQGLHCEPFIVDPQTENEIDIKNPSEYLMPNAEYLKEWDIYIHEWMGYITYLMAGYI